MNPSGLSMSRMFEVPDFLKSLESKDKQSEKNAAVQEQIRILGKITSDRREEYQKLLSSRMSDYREMKETASRRLLHDNPFLSNLEPPF